MTDNTSKHMVATFPVNGNWQPCRPEQQYENRFAQFNVVRASFAVVGDSGVWHHGAWNEDQAKRFARSMPGPATVVEVAPYWYCPAWGCVHERAVHEYDQPAQLEHRRPDAARYDLGCSHSAHVGMIPVRIVCTTR